MDMHAEELLKELTPVTKKSCSVSEQDPRLTHKVQANSAHRVDDMFRPHDGVPVMDVPIHNSSHPVIPIKTEKPIHRFMAHAAATGMSQREIAKEFGYSTQMVSQICRQRWFQDLVTYYIAEAGGDQVEERIKSAGVDSVEVLIQLRDDKATPASVRATAAMHLLDRLKGKPSQHILTEKKVPLDPLEEMKQLDSKIEAINATTAKHDRL